MKTSQRWLRFLALAGAVRALQAFLPTVHRPSPVVPRMRIPSHQRWDCASAVSMRGPPTTALAAASDGTDRGAVILGVVFLACVWMFSVPPEFRRAHICSTESHVNCVTADEWKEGIADYYANGGGVNFDFSVAQETKDFWAGN